MENSNLRTPLAIAQAYYLSWTNKNYDEASNLIDENVKFEMPINSYETKNAFMQAVRFTGDNAHNINLLAEFGNDTEAVLIYDFNFHPFGNMQIAEHFRTHNGKIVFIRHIHDTFHLRNTGLK